MVVGTLSYGGGDIVFDAKRSNQWIQWMQSHSGHSTQWTQWMQYTVDAVHSGCSRIMVYGCGDIVFDTKMSNQWIQWMQSHSTQWMQWMQYTGDTVDAVCGGCSRIVVYGGGTLYLIQNVKAEGHSGCSTRWNSDIWWWGHCPWCKKVKPVDAVCSGCSGIVVYGGGGHCL